MGGAIGYDAAGNQINYPPYTLTYDALSRKKLEGAGGGEEPILSRQNEQRHGQFSEPSVQEGGFAAKRQPEAILFPARVAFCRSPRKFP